MSALSQATEYVSVEEYLAGEDGSDQRYEYIDGRVYAMTGASRKHGLIANAIAYALTPAARQKKCQLFTSDMKLRLGIGSKTVFYYPDVLLSCSPMDKARFFRSEPCLLIEVLSTSTARIDRREKLLAYQSLPSLQTYLLVEQDQQQVEAYQRADGWSSRIYTEGSIEIPCLSSSLALADIYCDCV